MAEVVAPGDIPGGRYLLERPLGTGGMEGETLAERLSRGPLPWREAAGI